jgi:hypothetical protein
MLEELHIKLSGEVAICGELAKQDLAIIASYAIGTAIYDKPRAAESVGDFQIASLFEIG